MTRSSGLPATLDAFLAERILLFHELPDDDWFDGAAAIYKTTPEIVKQAFRSRWSPAPVAVRVVERTPQPASLRDTQHPFDRVLNALRARSCRIVPKHDARGREAKRATCPAHDDRNPSLVITADGPNVLLHCFGGCPTARIVSALGLKLADLFSGPPQARVPRRRRTQAVTPPAAPKLSPEERLARKRMLTAARTQRWRERRQTVESVTHQNIRSVTCDARDAGDAPNVLRVTSHVESREELSADLDRCPTRKHLPEGLRRR